MSKIFNSERKVEKVLKKWYLTVPENILKYDCVFYESEVFIKIYYDGILFSTEIEHLYRSVVDSLKNTGYVYKDITLYEDNHELCIVMKLNE